MQEILNIVMSDDEYDVLVKLAEEANMSIDDYASILINEELAEIARNPEYAKTLVENGMDINKAKSTLDELQDIHISFPK